jgi:hypothetical protein
VNVFPFIEAEKAEQRNVAKACALLDVPRSAFYDWHKHVPSAREVADEELGGTAAHGSQLDVWPGVRRTPAPRLNRGRLTACGCPGYG